MLENNHFSQIVSNFHGLPLPEAGMTLAGYGALIAHYDLQVPFPDSLAVISTKHKRYTKDRWGVFTVKHKPADTLAGHLTFALKYEGVDLGILNALFKKISPAEIEALIRNQPTGRYSRRVWFLYEWLTERRLEMDDVTTGNYTEALDSSLQYPGPSTPSKRHRVRNNLPGTQNFCPLIRRTEKLEALIAAHLSEKAKKALGVVHPDILARAAAFLLLKDSKASYAIEGERPAYTRAERWGQAIGQAGLQKLTARELLRLQEIVIGDKRFTKMGWRKEGGFIGVHDRVSNAPIPDHISARWQDIAGLIEGLIATDERLSTSDYDPVLAAALIAFGFVFIHPFEDGNGRIHRYLIHHVLTEKGFAPKGIVFPVSAVILERIDQYRQTLEAYSKPRLGLIEWEPAPQGNVEVLNETIDLYRYFDATRQAEFLFDCVRETIEKTLPEEVACLGRHDKMSTFIKDHFDMPDKVSEILITFLRQGNGKLSKRAREKEFHKLTRNEVGMLEAKFAEIFSKT
ncbi:MAG TPA: Fic family protein [Verrucomicrobiae bacterium]|nr:Fic family protein [Verrucomicrobiae bacterium]